MLQTVPNMPHTDDDPLKHWLITCIQNNPTDPIPEQILDLIENLQSLNARMYGASVGYTAPVWIIESCKHDPQGRGQDFLASFGRQRASVYNENTRYELPNYGGFAIQPQPPSSPPPLADEAVEVTELRR